MIWSILQNSLYRVIKLENNVVSMTFTPDNAYLLTVLEGARDINIWHNYIGRVVTASGEPPTYRFLTTLNHLTADYREVLTQHQQHKEAETAPQSLGELDSLLDLVDDASDTV
jgi:hypothetical protein